MTAAIPWSACRCCSAGWRSSGPLRAPDVAHADMAEVGLQRHVELCDRRLDEVVFAGTHNSMAASAEDCLFARQTGRHRGPARRRRAGVPHRPALRRPQRQDLVRTDLRSESDKELAHGRPVSPSERAATEGVLALLGGVPPDERPTVYLCHVYCELGATPAVDAFRRVHDFLRENPNEVIVLVLEDFVEAADAIAVLERGGLAGHAWRGGRASRCRRWAR